MSQPRVDRAAMIRSALLQEVAVNGLHGTSMAAVARRAGVAAGTAYTYYPSKEALVVATYVEAKARLAAAATSGLPAHAAPRARFLEIWHRFHAFFAAERELARFFQQIESSPFEQAAHAQLDEAIAPLRAALMSREMSAGLVALPEHVLFELALGPAIRLAASGEVLDRAQLDAIAAACWRAVAHTPVGAQAGDRTAETTPIDATGR